MRNLKKILALVLSLMMVLSVMVTASATDFADDADITNKEAVEVMSALGILSGSQGKFDPKGTLTREQAAKIIAFVKLGADADALLKGTGSTKFKDVTSGWAYDYISYCANEGIISGYTVDGAKNFGPKGTLTGYDFGKMVLNAAGVGTADDYKGSQWKINVAAALKSTDNMLDGLDTLVLSANITREQAAQLAWNAMIYTANGGVTGKYLVTSKTGEITGATANVAFDSRLEAIQYVAALNVTGAKLVAAEKDLVADNGSYCITAQKDLKGSIALDVYGVDAPEYTSDAFGRSVKVWTSNKVKDAYGYYVKVDLYTETPAVTYTNKATVAQVVSDLKNYKVTDGTGVMGASVSNTASGAFTTNVKPVTDGADGSAVSVANKESFAAKIAELTKDNATVEVYTNARGYVTKVIVINTYADVVTSFTPANAQVGETKGTLTLKSGLTFKTNAFAKEDKDAIVLYTKSSSAVVSVVKAEKVTGAVTGYTSKGVFTVGGVNYEIASETADSFAAAGLVALYGKNVDLYLGKNGTVVYAKTASSDYVAPANYAALIQVAGKYDSSKDTALGSVNATVTAQVRLALDNGTVGVYDLPITKVGTKYYITLNGKAVDIAFSASSPNDSDNTSDLTTALETKLTAGLYTYELNGTTVKLGTVGKIDNAATKSAAASAAYTAELKKATIKIQVAAESGDADVLLTSATKFVFYSETSGVYSASVVTGVANIADIASSKIVGLAVDSNVALKADGTYSRVNTANVVFVNTAAAATTVDHAYVTGEYAFTGVYAADGVTKLYTYTAYTPAGKTIELYSTLTSVTAGLYAYDNNNVIGAGYSANVVAKAEYTKLSDEIVKIGSEYFNVDSTAVTVVVAEGASLVDGCKVIAEKNATSGKIVVIYVVEAAN